jgi:FSR family fosmidomycin resistance protein-like MFS transporter
MESLTAAEMKADSRIIISLALVHFIGDLYQSFITPLLPLFVENFALTLTQVGIITGISRFLAFVVQPSAGYVADHYQTRFFVLGGPLLSILFIPLLGVAPSFFSLIVLASLGSIGSSMFHPTCAGMVSSHSGRHIGFSMSIFGLGGTLSFAVGPLLITSFVGAFGLRAMPFTMVFGLAAMIYLFFTVPVPVSEGLKNQGFLGSIREVLGPVWKSIVLIWIVMTLRSFVGQSFFTFLPILYAEQGYSLVTIGGVISLLVVAGAISGLLAGHFSDVIGYKPIFYVTHGLATPSLILVLYLSGAWLYVAIFLTGFFIMATLPLGVAMAQTLAPKGKSMVASLMMGLAFGTGGMLTPITGKLADTYSLPTILTIISIIPLLTVALIHFAGEKRDG